MVPEDIILSRFNPVLGRRSTFKRTLAAQDPTVALLRLGEGLISALAEYVRWDDRGQAFAFWREVTDWDPTPGEEWIGFRFDLVVETDTHWAEELLQRAEYRGWSRAALWRRADAALPPAYERIFLDAELREVQDPALLAVLTRPFDKRGGAGGRDYNLTKHRSGVLDEVVAPDRWEGLCRGARAAAETQLRGRPALLARCQAAASAAGGRQAVLQEQLALRAAASIAGRGGKSEAARDLDLEQAVGEAIIRGIQHPRVRVDSVGLIVIAGRKPDHPEATALSTAEATTSRA
jgi:ATP-dependent helicase HepA